MSCTRKYSRTAFLSHSLTIQPPLPSGSATRRSPASMRSITRSTTGRVEPSISSGVSRSEEHTSELQSLMSTSHAVFCLKKKKQKDHNIQKYNLNYRNI